MSGVVYEMRFKGEYFTTSPVKGSTAPYEFTVNMNEAAKKLGFLHVFVRQVLPDPEFQEAVKAKYPDWRRHKTHNEDGGVIVKPDGTREPIQELGLMNHRQLVKYINSKGLQIYTDLYPTAAELKQAITDFRDNNEAFLKAQDKKALREGPKLEVQASLRQLNDWGASKPTLDPLAGTPDLLAVPQDLEDADALRDLLNTV